jgi:predicted CXXCH cytochrome family protein
LALVFQCSINAYGGILNSKHDMTADSSGPSNSNLLGGTDICIYCHAPHKTVSPQALNPLWNRSNPVTTAFTMYGSTIAGNETDTEPNSASLRCLCCHDGATAVNAFGGSSGTPGKTLGSPYAIASEGMLEDDHPVSITAAGMGASIGSAEAAGLVFYGAGESMKVECPTCHDPHMTDNGKFLRMTNHKSGMCQACHNK